MKKYRNLLILIVVAVSLAMASCSNMHLGTNMGVNVNFGSNGPTITPHLSVGMSSGGYYNRW